MRLCPVCGRESLTGGLCERCLKERPPYEKVYHAGPYTGVLKDAIHALKYNNARVLSFALGKMLADLIKSVPELRTAQAVVPVPISRQKMAVRGFNQSLELAKIITEETGIPVLPQALTRVKDTPTQTHLTVEERTANVKDAFKAQKPAVEGKILIMLDDVYTTRATAIAAVKELKKAGAKNVYVVMLAAVLQSEKQK